MSLRSSIPFSPPLPPTFPQLCAVYIPSASFAFAPETFYSSLFYPRSPFHFEFVLYLESVFVSSITHSSFHTPVSSWLGLASLGLAFACPFAFRLASDAVCCLTACPLPLPLLCYIRSLLHFPLLHIGRCQTFLFVPRPSFEF